LFYLPEHVLPKELLSKEQQIPSHQGILDVMTIFSYKAIKNSFKNI
jgi:hypothetical protein